MHEKVTGIIIAGGKSNRMGKNKALVKYRHQRLIDCAIQIFDPVVDFLIISSNTSLPNVPYVMVKDEIKDIGPLGGLYTALKKSHTQNNIVIACDIPNVSSEFYDRLVKKLEGFDAAVAEHSNGKIEPLVAAYSKSIIPTIEECIDNKDYKLINLLKRINTNHVITRRSSMFVNINTPDDLE